MQGLFLQAGRDMVVQKFGSKFWKKVSAAGHLPEDFDPQRTYDEEAMFSMTRELAKILGFSNNKTLLEAVGYWFVHFSKNTEHGKALTILGPKFTDALRNLNQISSITACAGTLPTVRCTAESENSARLQISPPPGKEFRKQATPLVVGLVKGIAEELYSINSISITQERERDPSKIRMGSEFCDEFRVSWNTAGQSSEGSSPANTSPSDSPTNSIKLVKLESSKSSADGNFSSLTIGLPPAQLAMLFPFHFIFNRHMELVQYGHSLAKTLGAAISPGKKAVPLFQVVEPSSTCEWTFQDAESWCGEPVAFRFTVERASRSVSTSGGDEGSRNSTISVIMRGQVIAFRTARTDSAVIGFFGSPQIRGADTATTLGLSLADFAVHDSSKEALFSSAASDSMSTTRMQGSATADRTPSKKHKDRSLRMDPKDIKEKASSSGILRTLLGSKYDDTVYENVSAVAPSMRVEAGRVEALLNEADITSARRPSSLSATSSSPAASSLSLIEVIERDQTTGARISSALQELLMRDSWHRFQITRALLRTALEQGQVRDCEEMTQAVVRFFGYRNRLAELLSVVLDDEIAMAMSGTANSGVFLRTDSIATKTLGAVVELYDENAQYLRLCLSPILSLETPPEDPARVLKLTQSVVDSVCKSSAACPPMIRNALALVREKASRSIPDMAIAGVVNVLFLRYVNPALVNPERYKLMTKRQTPAQQKLGVQMAKQLQALVNGSMSERFTPIADSLVTQANKDSFSRYLSELTADSILQSQPSAAGDPTWVESPQIAAQSYNSIRDFMIKHIGEIFSAAQVTDGSGISLRNGLQQFVAVCLMEAQTSKRA